MNVQVAPFPTEALQFSVMSRTFASTGFWMIWMFPLSAVAR